MQDVVAYLSGEGMNSQWHVVTSREGAQWYLSIYSPHDECGVWHLAYRSPGAQPELLPKVQRAPGTEMYFPHEDAGVIGAAELEEMGVQDVVVRTHLTGADCGTASVTVLGSDGSMRVRMRAQVTNFCDLRASIAGSAGLKHLELAGPYYAPKDALCCPTKPRARATLAYANNAWRISPAYFTLKRASRAP